MDQLTLMAQFLARRTASTTGLVLVNVEGRDDRGTPYKAVVVCSTRPEVSAKLKEFLAGWAQPKAGHS